MDTFLSQVILAIIVVIASYFVITKLRAQQEPKNESKKTQTKPDARSRVVPTPAEPTPAEGKSTPRAAASTSRPLGIPSLKIPTVTVETPRTSDSLTASSSSPSSAGSADGSHNQDDENDTNRNISQQPSSSEETVTTSRKAYAALAANALLSVTPLVIPITPPTTPSSAVIDEGDDEPGPSPSFRRKSLSALRPLSHPALAQSQGRLPSLGVDLEKIREQFGGMPEDEQDRFLRFQVSDSQCSEVAPHIFLSSHKIAESLDELKKFEITHVLNLAAGVCDNSFANNPEIKLTYMSLDLADGPSEDIICYVYDCIEFIDSAINSGGNVLVHCWQGVSRSTSMVVAWIMLKQRLAYDETLTNVRKVRSVARPNTGFMCQLLDWGIRLNKGPKKNMIYVVCLRQNVLVARLIRDHDLGSKHELQSFANTCVIIHSSHKLFLWEGSECPKPNLGKGLEHAARLRAHEHAPELSHVQLGSEPEEFWSLLAGKS
eukprot:c11440_g1_i1.p1 GENE.c11440_g1_i1~~c11440_g1_i1.p1  ORF type:complete len:489 (+),score=71.53 c11440_g1_i1:102-1568(+)